MRKQLKKVLSTVLSLALVSTSISVNDFVVNTYAETVETDVELSSMDGGSSYLNFVRNTAVKLSLEDKEEGFTFDLYDVGGKDGAYDNSDNSSVRLIAPNGYSFVVTGKVKCENNYNDFLSIYDVVEEAGEQGELVKTNKTLGKERYGNEAGDNINLVLGNSNEMLFTFHSDGSFVLDGIDIKVSLYKLNKEYDIKLNDVNGGKLTSLCEDVVANKAYPGKEVIVKSEVEYGYSLSKIIVELPDGRKLDVEGGNWYSDNTAKFIMPMFLSIA